MIRILLAGACLAVLISGIVASQPRAARAASSSYPTAHAATAMRHSVLRRLNARRRASGARALREHPALRGAAHRYARQLVAQHFFAHVSPAGSTMVDRIRAADYLRGARSWTAGENLAWGRGSHARPSAIVRAWMASPEHRRNILDPAFREIGIGIAPGAPVGGGGPAATYVTEFGARR